MATTIATLMGSEWGIWGRAGVSLCQNVRHLVIIVVAFHSYKLLNTYSILFFRLTEASSECPPRIRPGASKQAPSSCLWQVLATV